jgi:hypothetical protein
MSYITKIRYWNFSICMLRAYNLFIEKEPMEMLQSISLEPKKGMLRGSKIQKWIWFGCFCATRC